MSTVTFRDYTEQGPFRVGDVVHADGSCAILGDVIDIEDDAGLQLVTVRWRVTETQEMQQDLFLKERKP